MGSDGRRGLRCAGEAKLTSDLREGEFRTHVGQRGLCPMRTRVRRAEDPPAPLDHVLHDGLGFQ